MPSLFGTLKLLHVDLSLGGWGGSHSDCERCPCKCQHGVVLSVELFGAHVSWIVFSAFFFQGRQSRCLSLTTVCPHSKGASAFSTEGQEDAAGRSPGCTGVVHRRLENKKQRGVERGDCEGKSGRENL